MTGGEEEQKKGEGKGFAGLASLVSDVDSMPPPAAKEEIAASTLSSERPPAQAAQLQPTEPNQTYQEPAQPSSSGSSGGKWVLGIAAVIGVLWLIGQSDKSSTTPVPDYSPPSQTATPSYSPPAEPQVLSRPQESMPPVGQNLVFSAAQIRYCLAEEIRLEGAKSAVNHYIDSDVDRFNAMVADYNGRCGSFRYRSGALESSRRDLEKFRDQLQDEGRSKFTLASTNNLPSSISPKTDTNTKYLNGESFSAADENILMEALSNGIINCPTATKCSFGEFEIQSVDFDMDGESEYLISHENYCGSGGCSILLLKKSKAAGWKKIASAFGSISLSNNQENGFLNLIVATKSYRPEGGFDWSSREYKWDGKGYRPTESNP